VLTALKYEPTILLKCTLDKPQTLLELGGRQTGKVVPLFRSQDYCGRLAAIVIFTALPANDELKDQLYTVRSHRHLCHSLSNHDGAEH
jgi:hypothetical protein